MGKDGVAIVAMVYAPRSFTLVDMRQGRCIFVGRTSGFAEPILVNRHDMATATPNEPESRGGGFCPLTAVDVSQHYSH